MTGRGVAVGVEAVVTGVVGDPVDDLVGEQHVPERERDVVEDPEDAPDGEVRGGVDGGVVHAPANSDTGMSYWAASPAQSVA